MLLTLYLLMMSIACSMVTGEEVWTLMWFAVIMLSEARYDDIHWTLDKFSAGSMFLQKNCDKNIRHDTDNSLYCWKG